METQTKLDLTQTKFHLTQTKLALTQIKLHLTQIKLDLTQTKLEETQTKVVLSAGTSVATNHVLGSYNLFAVNKETLIRYFRIIALSRSPCATTEEAEVDSPSPSTPTRTMFAILL
jgi:hypothetical protein